MAVLRSERGDRWANRPSSRAAWDGQEVERGEGVGVRVSPAREDDPAVLTGEHRSGGRDDRSQGGGGQDEGESELRGHPTEPSRCRWVRQASVAIR